MLRRNSLLAALLAVVAALVGAAPASGGSGTTRSTKYLLNHLTVSSTYHLGYDRDLFKLWDYVGNGCDVRDEVLIRDAVHVTVGPDCKLTGTSRSPYDGIVTTNSSDEQVDHLVPLGAAWGAGAWHWSAATREAFANDLATSYDLIATSAHSNESKGDDDPSQYVPPRRSFDCTYERDYVAVLWRWQLHISPSLKAYLRSDLAACGWPTVFEPPRPSITDGATSGTGPKPTTVPTSSLGCTKTSTGSCIRAGEFCSSSEAGKYGYDGNGAKLKCSNGHWRDT